MSCGSRLGKRPPPLQNLWDAGRLGIIFKFRFEQRMKHCGNLPQIPSLAAFGGRHRNFWFFMSEMECLRGSSRVHLVVQVYSVRRGLIMHIPEKRESTRVAME